MKHIALVGALALSACFSQGYAETLDDLPIDTGLFELEQELLSLEDELMNLETPLPLRAPEEIEISLETKSPELIVEEVVISDEGSLAEDAPEEEMLSIEEGALAPLPQAEIASVSSPTMESEIAPTGVVISFAQVFYASPLIYSLLFGMSLIAITVCLYSTLRLRRQSAIFAPFSKEVRIKLLSNGAKETLNYCEKNPNLLSRMLVSGLSSRKHGLNAIVDSMKSEGKRASVSMWQQLGILQDIAVIAPMLGLLGTVIGLFYAFYDLNRSFDSLTNLLDGLGISVGTTVAGIAVAILAMLLQSAAKFRLVRVLSKVEAEANTLAHLIDENTDR